MENDGYCLCGCGGKTKVAKQTDAQRGLRKGQPQKFIQGHHASGENNPAWRGGRNKHGDGYVLLFRKDHPHAVGRGYVLEHRLVAESALGRPLPSKAVVHHHDEIRDRNVPGNLVLCEDENYHKLLHMRMRALTACGNANAYRCTHCKGYDRQNEITIIARKSGEIISYHRDCNTAAGRRWRQLKRQERVTV